MAHTPHSRSELARARPADSLPSTAQFEAPLAQSPYPVAAPSARCLDTRDLDLDDGIGPYENRKD